jgi:selenocysteine lyase/cysteine desulfurase
MDTTL